MLLLCAIVLFGAANVAAQNVKIIANPSVGVSSLSADDLRGVFLLKKTSLADGSHVLPVLLTEDAAFKSFAEHFCGGSGDALNTYYPSMVFSGGGAMAQVVQVGGPGYRVRFQDEGGRSFRHQWC